MQLRVNALARQHLQVPRGVIQLVLILVVNDLSWLQLPADLLLGNHPVCVATIQLRVALPCPSPSQLVASRFRSRSSHLGVVVWRIHSQQHTSPAAKSLLRIFRCRVKLRPATDAVFRIRYRKPSFGSHDVKRVAHRSSGCPPQPCHPPTRPRPCPKYRRPPSTLGSRCPWRDPQGSPCSSRRAGCRRE